MHYFHGLSEETVLWGMSYQNLSMYLATIPTYESSGEKTPDAPAKNKEEAELAAAKNFFKNT